MDEATSFSITIAIVLLFAVGTFFGSCTQRNSMEKSAVKANVGHYIIDSKTGVSSFQWLTNK